MYIDLDAQNSDDTYKLYKKGDVLYLVNSNIIVTSDRRAMQIMCDADVALELSTGKVVKSRWGLPHPDKDW